MRNAARRNETANCTLEVGIAGAPKKPVAAAPTPASPSKWGASGDVKCSAGSATLDKQCGFRVVRNLTRKSADIWSANIARNAAELFCNRKFWQLDSPGISAWQFSRWTEETICNSDQR
jgi:hypothetical protein